MLFSIEAHTTCEFSGGGGGGGGSDPFFHLDLRINEIFCMAMVVP